MSRKNESELFYDVTLAQEPIILRALRDGSGRVYEKNTPKATFKSMVNRGLITATGFLDWKILERAREHKIITSAYHFYWQMCASVNWDVRALGSVYPTIYYAGMTRAQLEAPLTSREIHWCIDQYKYMRDEWKYSPFRKGNTRLDFIIERMKTRLWISRHSLMRYDFGAQVPADQQGYANEAYRELQLLALIYRLVERRGIEQTMNQQMIEAVNAFVEQDIPHGSGINYNWSVDVVENGEDEGSLIIKLGNQWDVMDDMGSYVGALPFEITLVKHHDKIRGIVFIVSIAPTGFEDGVQPDDDLFDRAEGDVEGVFDGWGMTYGEFVELCDEEILTNRFEYAWATSATVRHFRLIHPEEVCADAK